MRRASDLFSTNDRQQIADAVAQTESRTAAEIVPVIAASSGRYDRAEDVVGLWVGLALLAVVWWLLPGAAASESGSWSDEATTGLHLLALIVAVVVGFVLGAFIGSRVGWLRHLFTPAHKMREEVLARSRQVFFDNRVYRTTRASGVLIYVSLFERRAAILADQAVLDKLGQDALEELCNALTTELRSSGPVAALCHTIRVTGDRLAPVLPRTADDANELSDALVVLDSP